MESSDRPQVMVVDDHAESLAVMGELLHPRYRVRSANSGARALQLLAADPLPDLLLLEVMMPGLDGFTVLRRLRDQPRTRELPVILVTAMGDNADEERGLALGAVDFLAKPIRPTVLQARVATHVERQQARLHLSRQNRELGAEVGRRMRENLRISQVTLHVLRRLAETRDNETGNHLRRTSAYVRLLATRLAEHPRHAGALEAHSIDLMARSAALHDIGKVGIPDRVLHKHGPLDADERALMQSHAALGAGVIERAERDVGGSEGLGFLRCAKQIARHHHEHWDGTGYPDRLAGEAIPQPARLMAVADVFDALTSPRLYKEAWGFGDARKAILAERGRQFDPDVVDAFDAVFDELCAVARSLADAAADAIMVL